MTSNPLPVPGATTARTLAWLLPAASLMLVALVYTPDSSVPATPEPVDRHGATAPVGVQPIDHGAIDWNRVPMAPDAAPMSVAAYGS